ncbi:fibrinogen alpha chain-like [Anneissia japonica]|uniref:fibrinogen alpha chain-like n=1 Tax=Anneissia japonica TaxID=1529436 RepID=UPI00142576A9|nr:fibrinogen alpha chain-like [Anneissia japonica]
MMFYKFMLILAIVAANIPVNKGLISCTKSVIFTKYGFRPMSAEDTTILTTKAGSATQCTQFCLSRVQCQSIVYHNVTRLCELLSSVKQHDHKNTETGHVQYISYQPRDCSDLLKIGVGFHSGIYIIYPKGENNSRPVYCDMETDDGGWTPGLGSSQRTK